VHGQSHSQGFFSASSPSAAGAARRARRLVDARHGGGEARILREPNQVEGFFGILGKQSLGVAHCPSKAALREHIDAYIAHWNDDPTPFISTKPAASIIRSRKRMLDRISHAVHTAPLAKTLMW